MSPLLTWTMPFSVLPWICKQGKRLPTMFCVSVEDLSGAYWHYDQNHISLGKDNSSSSVYTIQLWGLSVCTSVWAW